MSAFEALVRQIFQTTKRVDENLQQLQKRASEIEQKYEPRREFERWQQSAAGKTWKQQQHQRQQGCCASCQRSVALKGAHIDHIKSLKHYPHLAVAPHNFQILCADCNLRKGSQEITH